MEVSIGEERIFETLLAAARHSDSGTQVRVAGGWVRDKLLGVQSHDIDIAVDNKTGEDFCKDIVQYLRSIGDPGGNLSGIPKNPKRSEHLHTSSLEICGKHIDFAQLRTEIYSSSSRVPVKVSPGSPEQDAHRRDFTINSLFYNLSTRSVEDFTGKGIADLNAGLIRTPVSPLEMFKDDPLRVLRAVRFASRYGFELDTELKEAGLNPEVHAAFRIKEVSTGLVMEEVRKMMFGKDPVRAMQLLRELGCIDLVFRTPTGLALPESWESSGAGYMVASLELLDVLDVSDENVKCVTALTSFLLPLKDYTYVRRGKTVPLSTHVVRDCLLYNENASTEVASLVAGVGNPCMDSWLERFRSDLARGKAVKFEGDAKVEVGLVLNGLLRLKGDSAFRENFVEAFVAVVTAYKFSREERVAVCKALKAAIVDSGLYKVENLLNGKDVLRILGVATGNSDVGSWLHRSFVWQLENGGSASDCEQWMRACKLEADRRGIEKENSTS